MSTTIESKEIPIPADEPGARLPVCSQIIVPGLIPPALNSKGEIKSTEFDNEGKVTAYYGGNLEDKLDEIARNIWRKHPWFHSLVAEVMDHKKSTTVIVVAGGLTFLSIAIAGYKFGVEHGEDLKDFYSRMQPHWPNMKALLSVASKLYHHKQDIKA